MKINPLFDTTRPLPDSSDICRMMMQLETPFDVMAWIMMETAFRSTDIIELRVADIQKSSMRLKRPGKTKDDVIPISPGLVETIEGYLSKLRHQFEVKRRQQTLWGKQPTHLARFTDQLLFPAWFLNPMAGISEFEPIATGYFVQAMQRAARAIGCEQAIHSNTLRLVCASRWMEQGMTIEQIQRNLGHRDLMTTLLMTQALRYGGLTFVSQPTP